MLGAPARLLKRFSLGIVVAALLGTASEFVYRSALNAQRDRVYAEFQLAAAQHIDTLRTRLAAVLDLQQLLGKHIDVAGPGTAQAFAQVSGPLMRVHPFISAIVYAGIDNAAQPAVRFPAQHVHARGAWPAHGTDLAAEGLAAQAALQKTLRTQAAVATPLLSPEAEAGEGIRLFSLAGEGLIGIYMHLSQLAQTTLWAGMDPDARDMAFTILDTTEDGRPGYEETLRSAQRAWITFRDSSCDYEGYFARGGSMEPMLINQCLARLTGERTKQLRQLIQDMGNQ